MKTELAPVKSEWYAACSAGGTRAFPYGDAYDAAACVGGLSQSAPADVGATAGCEGGLPGVFDMSGNVFEWESSCETQVDLNDDCRMRGGSFAAIHESEMRCDADYRVDRGAAYPTLGFRCCGG